MRTILLSELFTKVQVEKIMIILKQEDDVRWVNLKKYLQTLRVQLESKGALPEYIFYVIQYQATEAEVRPELN